MTVEFMFPQFGYVLADAGRKQTHQLCSLPEHHTMMIARELRTTEIRSAVESPGDRLLARHIARPTETRNGRD